MSWRFRKTVSLGLGYKLNFNKRGTSLTVKNLPGLTHNISSAGVRRTISIPGTGLSHVSYPVARKATAQIKAEHAQPTPNRDGIGRTLFAIVRTIFTGR